MYWNHAQIPWKSELWEQKTEFKTIKCIEATTLMFVQIEVIAEKV